MSNHLVIEGNKFKTPPAYKVLILGENTDECAVCDDADQASEQIIEGRMYGIFEIAEDPAAKLKAPLAAFPSLRLAQSHISYLRARDLIGYNTVILRMDVMGSVWVGFEDDPKEASGYQRPEIGSR